MPLELLIQILSKKTALNKEGLYHKAIITPGTYSSESIVAIRESGRYIVSIYFFLFSA